MGSKRKQLKGQHSFSGLSYLAVIEKSSSGFSGFLPDVPGLIAAESDKEKLLSMLSDSLYIYLEDCVAHGEELPAPATKTYDDAELSEYETVCVSPAQPEHVSIEIDRLVGQSGLTYAEVARRMKVPRSAVTRLTSPVYRGHSMETLRKLANALGYEVEVSFKRVD